MCQTGRTPSRCAMSASDRSWTVFAAGASMGVVTAAASLAAARYLSSPRVLASDKVRLEPLYAARGWRDAGTQCGAWSGEAQPRCVMARVASPSFGQESGSRCSRGMVRRLHTVHWQRVAPADSQLT